jgi:hypothetical protein
VISSGGEEPAGHAKASVFDVAGNGVGIGGAGGGRIEVAVDHAGGQVLLADIELGDEQEVGPAVGQVHSMDREHVDARLEMTGKVDGM